jgi:acyl-CoA thioesterase I
MFFGDSFVAGTGDPTGRGWVGHVTEAAARAKLDVTPYNLGIRGDTSLDVATRWRPEAARRTERGADNRVVFSFGANDAEPGDDGPAVMPGQSVQALATCLAGAQAAGLPAFVVGPGPVPADGDRRERVLALSSSYSRICSEFEIPYVHVVQVGDSATWVGEVLAGDGVHPRAAGYEELANLVLAAGFVDWLKTGRVRHPALRGDGEP